jgi:tail lysozyme
LPDSDYDFLAGLSANPNRPGDTSNFNPAFARNLAAAIREAKANGLNVGVESGYRNPLELSKQGNRNANFDAAGNSLHSYGLAADVNGIGQPGSATAKQWASIAARNGLYDPYNPNGSEWNHWQAVPFTLDQRPDVKASLSKAASSGDFNNVWAAANPFLSGGATATATNAPMPPVRPAAPAPIQGAPQGTGIGLLAGELAKRGVSPAATTGAIAGIMGEAGPTINPLSFNSKDPGGGSGGIGQWNRGRLVGPNGLLAFAQNAGVPGIDVNTPTDSKKVPLPVQAQYLGHELDTTYSGVLGQLKAAKSPQDALGVWVNSYENPADKAGAIAQRSQYLAPVAATLANGAPAPATPGTTLSSLPAAGAGAGGALPGFGTAQASNSFLQGLNQMTGGGVGRGMQQAEGGGAQPQQQDMRPSPIMSGPGLRNAASPASIGMQARQLDEQLTGYSPQAYGSSLNSQPMTWGSSPIGAPSWLKGAGPQQGQGLGTSLNSLQMAYGLSPYQMQMMMNPMMLSSGGGGYG